MKIALLYPGQGAQYAGMCRGFYDEYEAVRELFETGSQASGLDLAELCFTENDRLDLTEYTQPAMVCAELCMTAVVKEELRALGLGPAFSAGLSLGEYAAISEAGAISFSDAVRTVRERGRLMAEAVPEGQGAMAAVLNPDMGVLEEVLRATEGAYIANYNSPAQIVITGRRDAVEQALAKLTERGIKRCVLLNVSGPFHSPLLREAGEKLKSVLDSVQIDRLSHPYISNIDAELTEDEGLIRDKLVRQVSGSVRWQQSVEAMIAEGVDTWIEIGPGRTLTGFVQKILRSHAKSTGADISGMRLINIEKPEDMSKLRELSEEG